MLESLYKFRELEKYFSSCRRLIGFGCFTDQIYSALRSMHIYDPVIRTTLTTSKLWLSFQMFCDHLIWLNSIGILKIEQQIWAQRFNRFWLYSTSANLFRDFYELICVIQQRRSIDNLDSELVKLSISTPIKWMRKYPNLSCDLTKNFCDFLIPYAAVNNIKIHPSIVSILGIISTTMGILQVYDEKYRLSPC